MSAPFATLETSGRIATLTFNRPDSRNAVATFEDCDDLVRLFQSVNADSAISVLIVAAAGKSFSAGGNLKLMKQRIGIGPQKTPHDTRNAYKRGVQAVIRAMAELEVATVAAINGHAIGLGLDLAAVCDMRVAGASAQLASSFVKLGIVPGDGGAYILQKVLGYPRAAELILTGDTIKADEALRIGLVNQVVPDEALMSAARALAERVAVNPPRAVRLAKRLLIEARHARLNDVLELSAAYQALAHETADNAEAIDAFLEKRPPAFTGT